MKTKIALKVLAIENDGFHLLIKAYVNKKKANMLIDTGASKTVFDKNRIHHFVEETEFDLNDKLSTGLGTNTMESHIAAIKEMRLGEIVIRDYKTILLDLGHVNHSYQQLSMKPIDGVIGSDILNEFHAVINFGKKVLKLSQKKHGKDKGVEEKKTLANKKDAADEQQGRAKKVMKPKARAVKKTPAKTASKSIPPRPKKLARKKK